MILFGKNKKAAESKLRQKREDKDKKQSEAKEEEVKIVEGTKEISGNWSAGGAPVLKGFYVSEKASFLNGTNQYMFKIFKSANKPQVKSEVEKIFNVRVEDVKILNMSKKRRDMGRHPGFKAGFKKAIVILKKGYSIEQAKA